MSLLSTNKLKGKKFLITTGPTREAIDPVRYISNHSTGKMGFALAEYLVSQEADVFVVAGPVSCTTTIKENQIQHIISADEMLAACLAKINEVDVVIFTAAVADYKCQNIAPQKIKKEANSLKIDLIPNVDIAIELAKYKTAYQVFIGFALETENGIDNAIKKMNKKGFDFIVLNIPSTDGAGFGYDTNKISIINNDARITDFSLKDKSLVAVDIINFLIENKL